ncbi:MAG: hypothetical protein ACT4TC_17610, partial [Myxococcaceae bacterium]
HLVPTGRSGLSNNVFVYVGGVALILSMTSTIVWAKAASVVTPEVPLSQVLSLFGAGGFFAVFVGCILLWTRSLEDRAG